MKVIYRITSIPSTNPPPILYDDKDKLTMLCLQSFIKAFSDSEYSIHFILDQCSPEVDKMIAALVTVPYTYEKTDLGINGTMLQSYKKACEIDDFVLFQECDYLYNGVIGKTFIQALNELHLVSPYDHKNFYLDPTLHSETCTIKLVNNHHFRSTERNTMTWGCHSSLVKENLDILNHHGYLDGRVWYDLKERGHELYVPIPSFATHMVRDYLAPGVDWRKIWSSIQ